MTLVIAAPSTQDPRDDGFVSTIPGELLYRPFICATGWERGCGCERSWAGITSQKGTTIGEVIDRADITPSTYIDLIATYLTDTWNWDRARAEEEAAELAAMAVEFGKGAILTIELRDGTHTSLQILDREQARQIIEQING